MCWEVDLKLPGSIAQSAARQTADPEVRKFEFQVGHITRGDWLGYDFTVILILPLIQEGQLLLVTGESLCVHKYGLLLREDSLSRKSVDRLTGRLDMTLTVLTGP